MPCYKSQEEKVNNSAYTGYEKYKKEGTNHFLLWLRNEDWYDSDHRQRNSSWSVWIQSYLKHENVISRDLFIKDIHWAGPDEQMSLPFEALWSIYVMTMLAVPLDMRYLGNDNVHHSLLYHNIHYSTQLPCIYLCFHCSYI